MPDSVFGADVLGRQYLPPSPLYAVDQMINPTGTTSPASAPAPNPQLVNGSPAPESAGTVADGFTPRQVLGLLNSGQTGGFSVPSFMASLGAGLSSAGQNWNKPAAGAFASGAGAALQGGQQWANAQQDAKLKALHAAIAAWKVGDLAGYHQAITNLRAASAPRPSASSAPAAGGAAASGGAAAPAPPSPVANNPPPAAAPVASRSFAGNSATDVLAQARNAIARGAPPEAVVQRLAGFLAGSA